MSAQSQPVVIVGAGVSGLCCALHLQERGFRILLLEADADVGGRVRTDRVDGFLLDRGFQVLLTAYPEAQDMLDLYALRLGSFAPGAMVRTGSRFARIADPFRRPGDALRTMFSGVATPLDALRIARLRRRVGRGAPQDLLGGSSHATLDALRAEGFSERIIEGFFRPFLGGVLLDRELRGSSRALEFLFRMFAEGDAALPAQGMGAIPSQLAARLAPGTLRTRTRVARLDRSSVTLESGEHIDARALVVATAARAAAKLIPGLPVPEANPACCVQFDAPRAPAVEDFLVLDGNGKGPVNELCVPSQVVPGYAPPSRALVSASVLAPVPPDDAALEAAVRHQLTNWFGPDVSSWRLLRIDRIPDALPFQPPGSFEPAGRSTQLSDHLFICGDYRDLASLQGAMASGRRAAIEVAGALGGPSALGRAKRPKGSRTSKGEAMKFELPELPYAIGDLEPHLTAKTLEFHYDRHHRGYLEKLQGLIEGTPHETIELSDLVIRASGEIFNNAAQVWNHTFYWNSMAPDGGGQPSGRIDQAIVQSFGSFAAFQKEFIASAVGLFGSGYVWLTFDPEQERVAIEPMKDAESPLLVGRIPLLGLDLWEHAYYLDYQNARQRYVETFLSHLANWRFANENLETSTPKSNPGQSRGKRASSGGVSQS